MANVKQSKKRAPPQVLKDIEALSPEEIEILLNLLRQKVKGRVSAGRALAETRGTYVPGQPQLPLFEELETTLERLKHEAARMLLSFTVECPAKYDRPVPISRCQSCVHYAGSNGNRVICAYAPDNQESRVHPNNKLNELAGNEWMFFTKSVLQTSYPAAYGHELRKKHGANKPPLLMKHIIEFFTKPGQVVLDPFAGVGGTLLGASLCNRKATGIELSQEWVDIYHQVCDQESIPVQEMIQGDCLVVLKEMQQTGRVFDFIATDPPYSIALPKTMCDDSYNIQHRRTDFYGFSDSEEDLRNLASFDAYYDKMEEVIADLFPLLRDSGYMAMILRDSYQQSRYIPASYELAKRAERVGFVLKGIKIWYQTGARVRPYGYPAVYVPNIVHQNILIFRKET